MQVSAYIPCYNGGAALRRAIDGFKSQESPVDELFVVDNHSRDDSARIAQEAGVNVIRLERDMGRGAARGRAMEEAKFPLVACCDASIELPRDFVRRAVRWFDDDAVAAVCGRISQKEARTAADRWWARHLFRTKKRTVLQEDATFTTGAAMVRASAVKAVGGYREERYDGEDADLGQRLLEGGYKVIFDPELIYWQVDSNSVSKVLERYWRWNRAKEKMGFGRYLKQIKYSVTQMAQEDMESADVGAALISIISPHYQFWKDRLG